MLVQILSAGTYKLHLPGTYFHIIKLLIFVIMISYTEFQYINPENTNTRYLLRNKTQIAFQRFINEEQYEMQALEYLYIFESFCSISKWISSLLGFISHERNFYSQRQAKCLLITYQRDIFLHSYVEYVYLLLLKRFLHFLSFSIYIFLIHGHCSFL